jgi:hypothetical protein
MLLAEFLSSEMRKKELINYFYLAYGRKVTNIQFIPLYADTFAVEFTTLEGKAYCIPSFNRLSVNSLGITMRDVTPEEKYNIDRYLKTKKE